MIADWVHLGMTPNASREGGNSMVSAPPSCSSTTAVVQRCLRWCAAIHVLTRFGLTPYVIAVQAIEAPGFKQACISSSLATSSYCRRPSRLRPMTRRSCKLSSLSSMCAPVHVHQHGHVASVNPQRDARASIIDALPLNTSCILVFLFRHHTTFNSFLRKAAHVNCRMRQSVK